MATDRQHESVAEVQALIDNMKGDSGSPSFKNELQNLMRRRDAAKQHIEAAKPECGGLREAAAELAEDQRQQANADHSPEGQAAHTRAAELLEDLAASIEDSPNESEIRADELAAGLTLDHTPYYSGYSIDVDLAGFPFRRVLETPSDVLLAGLAWIDGYRAATQSIQAEAGGPENG